MSMQHWNGHSLLIQSALNIGKCDMRRIKSSLGCRIASKLHRRVSAIPSSIANSLRQELGQRRPFIFTRWIAL